MALPPCSLFPGTFATATQVGYNQTATGQNTITSTWVDPHGNPVVNTVTLVWKNYPYLSITSVASSSLAKVGDPLRITIKIIGNGAALQPKPIDVLLLLDNSGSMGVTSDSTSRISQSKIAAVNFINQMKQGKDRVGVIFYDKNTYPSFSVYVPLTYDLTSAKNNISAYTRSATNGYHTRTRYALYEAITLMKGWSSDRDSVKAIILMTDGVWSMEGDPLARGTGFDMTFGSSETDRTGLHSIWAGNVNPINMNAAPYRYFDDLGGGTAITGSRSDVPNGQPCDNTYKNKTDGKTYSYLPNSSSCAGWVSESTTNQETQLTTTKTLTYYTNAEFSNQNMSVYANSSKIRVYSIGFGSDITGDISNVLTIISNANAGFYVPASDSASLTAMYTKIAGDLNVQAGGHTTMDMNFGTLSVNNTLMSNVTDYLNYTALPAGGRIPGLPTDSTYVDKYHTNPDTTITDYGSYTRDDTQNWTATSRDLSFDVGTMQLNDTWQTTFQFNLTGAGKLDLFGPGSGSAITFTDSTTGATQSAFIPSIPVTVLKNLVNTGFGSDTLLVDNLNINTGASGTNILMLNWSTLYTGPQAASGVSLNLYSIVSIPVATRLPSGLPNQYFRLRPALSVRQRPIHIAWIPVHGRAV